MAFFASPAKKQLRAMLEKRTKDVGAKYVRSASTDSVTGRGREPVLGVSEDPGRDIDEAIQEIRVEVERARTGTLEVGRRGRSDSRKEQ